MRDLFRHRTQLITRYLRQHGIPHDWDAFITQADTAHQRAIRECLIHDRGYRRLTQAKAELDRVLTTQRYAACTSPLLTDQAWGEVLFFLHPDSFPPAHGFQLIEQALADDGVVAAPSSISSQSLCGACG